MRLVLPALCAVLVAAVPGAGAAASAVPSFEHAIVIVFENKERGHVLGNRSAATFNRYASRFANLTAYYAVTHPSLPNYLALVSGSTHGITRTCTRCVVDAPSLADTLEGAGRTWKTYAEGLPSAGYTGAASGRYAKKHNPFLYFRAVVKDPARRAHVVPLRNLDRDLKANAIPDFALIVPDLCHSMHDCSVSIGDAWLRRIAAPLLTLPNTAIFVVFDEGRTWARGGGHTPALVLGTAVLPGSRYRAFTGHYAVLRTVEEAWALPLLGRSSRARPITGIWN